jgi:hypothetical protein
MIPQTKTNRSGDSEHKKCRSLFAGELVERPASMVDSLPGKPARVFRTRCFCSRIIRQAMPTPGCRLRPELLSGLQFLKQGLLLIGGKRRTFVDVVGGGGAVTARPTLEHAFLRCLTFGRVGNQAGPL